VFLHYLVKYRYSKITIIRINTSEKLTLSNSFVLIFVLKLNYV